MKLNHTLAGLGFDVIIAEHEANTVTGKELFNRYQSYLSNNTETMSIVNNFVKEAQNCIYDSGVQEALKDVVEYIDANRVSWALATVVENINNDNHTWNFLNKSAIKQVETLLEMQEEDVVKYIKAGALKNCQYVGAIHNVVKSVTNARPIREEYSNYSSTHPFSLLENNGKDKFFAVMNRVYKIDENANVTEASSNEVSNDFKMVMGFINSNKVMFENETISYVFNNNKFVIEQAGKVMKITPDNKKTELTVEQFRDNSNNVLRTFMSANKNQYVYDLEMMAKICENFDNFCVLDNVNIINSNNAQFVLIESNSDKTTAIVESFNSARPFRIDGNIMECVSYVKSHCNIDLTEKYQEGIRQVVENEEHENKVKMEMEITESAVENRRKKINEMIERYKNDPAKLAVLSQCALALNDL